MPGFYTCFLQSAERFPDRIAVELQHTDGTLENLSYSDLRARGESVGRWLRDSGMSEGIRCAILAANGPLWVTAYLGIMAAGAVAVPLDTAFNHQQINKLLWDCGATVIFTDGRHLPQVESAVGETLVRIIMIDGSGEGRYANLLGMLAAGPGNFNPAEVRDDDLAVIMYTSGTTADPKGVMLTHSNLLAEARAVFASIDVSERDSILGVLPLFHALAQMANLLLPFAAGARIVYLEEMNTTELLRALSERQITIFCCVPQFFYLIHDRIMKEVESRGRIVRTVFRFLMALSSLLRKAHVNAGKLFFAAIHRRLGTEMRYLITGGSAFDPNVGRDLQKLGFIVLQAYGLTETTGGATVTPPRANVMGSVGRPLKGVEVKIIDAQPSEGAPCPVGEVAISGGIVMKGYYNRPDATSEAIHHGWLLTGDLGYLDPRGNLFITGRKKEIIVLSSGKNIYPEEIEANYLRSPFIKEICVMGIAGRPGSPDSPVLAGWGGRPGSPDSPVLAGWGGRPGDLLSERLHAVIVPDFEVLRQRKIVNAREVIRFDVENLSIDLPSTKRILGFDLWPDPLPRTTTGKLKRFEIQRRVMAGERGMNGAAQSIAEPTAAEALWLAQPEVQQAITMIREAGKTRNPVLPGTNLELDLGFDSMERVELVVSLEHALGAEVDDKIISQVYTVRELIDAILQARGSEAGKSPHSGPAGWDAVLTAEPDNPEVLRALDTGWLPTIAWFLIGRMFALFMRVFFRLRVSGKDKLPKQGPFILSPNHQSFIDGPVVASQIPWRLFKNMFYVGTSEIFGQGFFKFLGRSFKLVAVDPDSNLVNAMRAGAFGLRQGKNLVLYPEGERSIDGSPKVFKKGAAILATHLRVPIYPVALEGFYDAWPRGRRFPRLARLSICFGGPIQPPDTEAPGEEVYREVTNQLRSEVVSMWEELRDENRSHEPVTPGA